jgi:dihydroneopterin triphosphate diphosphatase
MPRAPFQVLVIPFRRTADDLLYALFHRADADVWQWIAGGGEDDERPIDAARREAGEEAGIPPASRILPLDSVASIPVDHFPDRAHWSPSLLVIPEYAFGIEAPGEIILCREHRSVEWLDYDRAYRRVAWDCNRTALWELHRRLERGE